MSEHLHLSLWLRGYSPLLAPSTFRKVLGEFPFSKMQPGGVLKVQAIDLGESPLVETLLEEVADLDDLVAQAQEFYHPDTALRLETWWELWRWEADWVLRPSPVVLDVYGPEFDREMDEHVAIDLGPESLFLPVDESPGSHQTVESNLRSALHLINDLEAVLAVERKLLWSESGVNFAGRLGSLLG